jgi:UDP-N-acetyl-D-mannosaminouronate:lipid I N-acetyl-D-mannosaminouronosyltransferase
MQKQNINYLKVYSPTSRAELIEYAIQSKKILIAINAEKILNSTCDTRDLINQNIGYPDGIGAVWALKKKGCKNAIKIPGCELWLDIVAQNYLKKSFYLVGGTENVITETINKLKIQFPGISIINYRNGFLKTDLERNNLIDDISKHKPDIVFVAMGSPRQEILMNELHKSHKAVYQGLGGSFDVYTGNVLRAPKWWVHHNLEWAYRLLKQPTRIKRQLQLVKFFILLKFNRL